MLSSTKSRLAGKTLLQTLFFIILLSQVGFAQWVQLGLADQDIRDIAVREATIFATATDSTDPWFDKRGILYRSIDGGINWSQVVESRVIDIEFAAMGSVFMIRDSLFNGNNTPRRLFLSDDLGITWSFLNVVEQLPPTILPAAPGIVKISPAGTIFCGIYYAGRGSHYSGIAKSTDNGLTWTTPGWEIYGGRLFDFRNDCVITYGVIHNSMTLQAHLYLSEDEGDSWDFLGHAPVYHTVIHLSTLGLFSNGNILTGIPGDPYWVSPYGLFLSTDLCQSWVQVSALSVQVGLRLESVGMLIGTDSLGVFLLSENGDSLGSHNEGLTDLNVHSMIIDESDYIYIGTDNGLWKRPLSEIITSTKEVSDILPLNYNLEQNFPNPFNPSTKIKYSIPQSSNAVIKVFVILGNEIETLVNEEKPAGTYEVTWYAENLPSGVYFYQLRAGSFVETKKMILMK